MPENNAPNQEISPPRGVLTADFLTASDRISGQVTVRTRPLADQLNDATTSFLELENVYISPINRPSEIGASYPAATLRKPGIHLAIVARAEDGLSRQQTYGSYLGTVSRDVFLASSRYYIRGRVNLPANAQLRTFMTAEAEHFLQVFEATVVAVDDPQIAFSGGAALVNTEHIAAFCLVEEAVTP